MTTSIQRKACAAVLATLAAAGAATAQFDAQLPLQYGYQQTLANPAALQDHRVTVALPSVSAGFYTPVSVSDMGAVDNGTLYIDPDQLINRLRDRGNDQRLAVNVETLGAIYRRRGWQVGVSHRVRAQGSLDAPRDLVRLAAYGNAPYVGEELSVMPAVDAMAWQEFGVEGAVTLYERLTVGARAKYVEGTAAVVTTTADATIYTDPEFYAASVATNVNFQTAGLDVTFDDAGVDIAGPERLGGAGRGFGVDLGAVYRHEDEWELGLSLRDLGTVNWTGDANRHRSQGAYEFRGFEGNVFEDGGFEFDVEGTVDSVIAAVEFDTRRSTFRTSLPTSVQGSFRYRLAAATTANATMYAANQDSWHAGFGVGLSQRVGKWFHGGALAGMKRGGAFLGANVLFDVYGAQLYAACDNLLAVANLSEAHDAYVRVGMNLAFAEIKPVKAVRGWYDVKVEGINR